jgi:hypothetical protein
LAGKTKADVTALLYADVKSIVKDQESLDLVNRWIKERLPKFECVKSETERTPDGKPKCIQIKTKQ